MKILHQVRLLMEKNKYLKELIPPIRKLKFMRYRNEIDGLKRGLAAAQEGSSAFKTIYEAHKDEFEKISQMLEDDFSRKTLQAVINYRLRPRGGVLRKIVIEPEYFIPDIFGPVENEVFVDGGAFNGDTVQALVSEFGKGKMYYKKIYAWEPDPANLEKLIENCKEYKEIEVLPFGMWSEKTTLSFQADGGVGSYFDEDGTVKVPVDTIDNLCSEEKVTFIKMDIEGSEVEALHGAEHVIKRDKPRLAICLYHKPEHLYEVPLLVKEMVPEYKLYIRHHSKTYWDTILYAVCPTEEQ